MSLDMSTAVGKASAIVIMFGGVIFTAVWWNVLKKCGRKAFLTNTRMINALNVILFSLPGVYLMLKEYNVISLSVPEALFKTAAAMCFILPIVLNLKKWGFGYGAGFTLCDLTLSAVVYIAVYTIAFAIALGIAIIVCLVMSIPKGALWIGAELVGGEEFLVSPIGDNKYQDGNLNVYQSMGGNVLLGYDGATYYVHRAA